MSTADAGEPVVVVWNAADAAAALAVAGESGQRLRVLVPWSLAGVLGAAGVRALYEDAAVVSGTGGDRHAWIVGCGDHVGLAIAMLRNGFPTVLLDPAPPARQAVAGIAIALGARVLDSLEPGPRLDLAGVADPVRACRRWLASLKKLSKLPPKPSLPSLGRSCIPQPCGSIGSGVVGMKITQKVKKILDNYESDNPGTKANLARILSTGKLGGSGKLVILPVDQGFEHGPVRSFAPNPAGYDPSYHAQLALDAGLNAYASVLGMIEAVADEYAAQVPLILKMNSSNTLYRSKEAPSQAITASVDDAIRLGCAAIGYTIYPGSDAAFDMLQDLRELIAEAKAKGIVSVVWSYPRGGELSKKGELAIDISCYAAHIAALSGAHIIKVKLPSADIEQDEARKVYDKEGIDIATQAARVKHVMQAAFNSRRIVIFSGGAMKGADSVYQDAQDIFDGGGNGQIIGRNTFQRPRDQALEMLERIIGIFLGKVRHEKVPVAAQ